MVLFENIKPDDTVYIVEQDPLAILILKVVTLVYVDNQKRLRLKNTEMSFEIEFDDISKKLYLDKDLAYAVVVKSVFDHTNKYIREITDGYFNNYFELDKSVENYKILHPQLFV